MFRKIVSNLSFSPALVGQLGFYAKRLRKEEITRRLGLIFTALALVVQSLVVFQPAESANAASGNDFIYGGISSLEQFMGAYDKNTRNLKDIVNYFGITRDELTAARYGSWTVGSTLSWGYESKFSYAQGERKVTVTNSSDTAVVDVYGRPNRLFNGTNARIDGWIGHSEKLGWFAIMKACGNLVTTSIPTPPPKKCVYNATILAASDRCKPCPGKDTLWIEDESCNAEIVKTKTAANASHGMVDASSITAAANDTITYTLTIKNTGLNSASVPIVEQLDDVLEYATLIDAGGGTYSESERTLTWPSVTLNPSDSEIRVFAVKLLGTIPATAQGASEPTSYDCTMTNVFGNQVDIAVACPTEKIIETTVHELPTTGPTENMIFAGIVSSLVVYFYARSRQLRKEVRLIRTQINAGAL